VHPLGQGVYTCSADEGYKSLTVQLTNINAPDGTIMTVEIVERWMTATGIAYGGGYYPVTITQHKGSLVLSTANGDNVPTVAPSESQTNI
jgi:hypothetical protein